jgi:Bacterial Ig domain
VWVTLQPGGSTGAQGTFDEPTIMIAPPNNAAGSFSFSATVQDPGGLTAVATVKVTVSNLAPTAVADQYFTTSSLFTFDPTVNDTDPEGGPLTIQSISWVAPATGTISLSGNAVTVPVAHGTTMLNYTVVDQGQLPASSTITITSNTPPTMPDITDSTNQPSLDETVSPIDPDGDDTVVTCDARPNFDIQVIRDPNAGPPVDNGRVRIHFGVLNGFEGTDTFHCYATDPFGGVGISTVTLTITE